MASLLSESCFRLLFNSCRTFGACQRVAHGSRDPRARRPAAARPDTRGAWGNREVLRARPSAATFTGPGGAGRHATGHGSGGAPRHSEGADEPDGGPEHSRRGRQRYSLTIALI